MSTQTPAPVGIPGRPGAPGEEFFSQIRSLGIVRPDDGRWFAGVAAGLAQRWGVDPLLVRGGFVAVSLLGGAGLALYGLGWLFLPHPDGRIHAQEVLSGRVTAGFVGAVLAVLTTGSAGFGNNGNWFWWGPFKLLPLLAIGWAIWWFGFHNRTPNPGGGPTTGSPTTGSPTTGSPTWGSPTPGAPTSGGTPTPGAPGESGEPSGPESGSSAQNATPQYSTSQYPTAQYPTAQYPTTEHPSGQYSTGRAPAPTVVVPRPPDRSAPMHALTTVTLGVAILAGTAAGIVRNLSTSHFGEAWLVGAAVGLGVLGLGIVAAGILGRRSGGLAPIAILLAIVAVNGATWHNATGDMGSRTWRPVSTAELRQATGGYELGAGDLVVDLTDPALTTGATAASPTRVSVQVGAGHIKIVLPRTTPALVKTQVGIGQVDDRVHGSSHSGLGNDLSVTSGSGEPILTVDAELGVGNVEVTQ